MTKNISLLLPVYLCVLLCCSTIIMSYPTRSSFDLIILHNNDMHARFEQTNSLSATCKPSDTTANNCYGGFARVAHIIKTCRNSSMPVLYLNAGDTYTGTSWFHLFRDIIASDFMNILKPDAMSLGNHEFDLNIEGLIPFLNDVNFPVLATNLNLTLVPELLNTRSLAKSTVINVSNRKIGIIGYLTPVTKQITPPNDMEILDEIQEINIEAERLKTMENVTIIIALGHSGFPVDQSIAHDCPLVDLVIGGHDNTFLWNGPQPDSETPRGPYPFVVEQLNGKKVPVVQAYAFTKYLGYLELSFDDNGNLINFQGQPILLNHEIPEDSDVLNLLKKYRPAVDDYYNTILGNNRVFLNGTCKFGECNLGNFLTDALVHGYVRQYKGRPWTNAAIALYNSGGIRTHGMSGIFSMSDLISILPFDDDVVTVNVTGSDIIAALEHSVHRYSYTIPHGEFLQMSGVRVVYNLSEPVGNRVYSVYVLCTECLVPKYEKLNPIKNYTIILTDFMNNGGNGYAMFTNKPSQVIGFQHAEVVEELFKDLKIIYPGLDDRIKFIGKLQDSNHNNNLQTVAKSSSSLITQQVSLGLTFVLLLFSILYSV